MHEIGCLARNIQCPTCRWQGPLNKLSQHCLGSRLCGVVSTVFISVKTVHAPTLLLSLQIISDFGTGTFSSFLVYIGGDVFKVQHALAWTPLVMISPILEDVVPYLKVTREQNGIWILSVRSFADPDIAKHYKVVRGVACAYWTLCVCVCVCKMFTFLRRPKFGSGTAWQRLDGTPTWQSGSHRGRWS